MSDNWIVLIVLAVCISALLTVIIIPQVLDVAFKKNLFDNPDFRKIHKGTVPRLGGFVFLPVIFSVLGIVVGFSATWYKEFRLIPVEGYSELLVLFSSMTFLYLIGLKDDLVDVKYNSKFIVQGFCALLTVLSGAYITDFQGLAWIFALNDASGCLITVFLIIFIINSINLIDGIDGLASGLSMISLLFYGVAFYLQGDYTYALISFITLGTVGVFFLFNCFGSEKKRRKIFMGDTGALTLGMLLSFLVIEIARITISEDAVSFNPIVVAVSPLVLPLFDVVRVFLQRIVNGKSPFLPDKSHIHHRLLEAGLRPHATTAAILALQVFIIVLNLGLSLVLNINILVGIDIVIYVMTIWIVSRKKRELN